MHHSKKRDIARTSATSFVLIPGAGGSAWYWHLLVPLLEGAGHEAIAVDLPGDDERAGLDVYAKMVIRAIGRRNGYSTEFDLATYFLHDVPASVVREGAAHQRSEAEIVFSQPCRFGAWPDIPICRGAMAARP